MLKFKNSIDVLLELSNIVKSSKYINKLEDKNINLIFSCNEEAFKVFADHYSTEIEGLEMKKTQDFQCFIPKIGNISFLISRGNEFSMRISVITKDYYIGCIELLLEFTRQEKIQYQNNLKSLIRIKFLELSKIQRELDYFGIETKIVNNVQTSTGICNKGIDLQFIETINSNEDL